MENSSQHFPQGEEEFRRTDDDLFPMRRNAKDSHILKPLSIGCLTGQFHALLGHWNRLLRAYVIEISDNPTLKKRLPDFKMANKRLLKINLLGGATYTTASLGVFEILTEKLRTINNGSPLSLRQEACCGLTSGATAVLLRYPVYSAYLRTDPHSFSYGSLFSTLYHFVRDKGAFDLWKGSGLYISRHITADVGMLVSYSRSKKYLMESKDLSKGDAQLCASIISGFFAAICSHPCLFVKVVKDKVQEEYHLGDKHSYRNIPLYISQILTPYRGSKFYSKFFRAFGRWAPFCMVQWCIFEMLEESIGSNTRDSQTCYLGTD